MLLPCSRVMLQDIRRTQLITRRWLAVTEQTLPPEITENNSWELDDNGYKIKWFESTATPDVIAVMNLAEDEGLLKIPLNCLYCFLSFLFFSVIFVLCI